MRAESIAQRGASSEMFETLQHSHVTQSFDSMQQLDVLHPGKSTSPVWGMVADGCLNDEHDEPRLPPLLHLAGLCGHAGPLWRVCCG